MAEADNNSTKPKTTFGLGEFVDTFLVKTMTNTADEAQELISLIRTRGEAVEDAAGAITLIRLIPYTGGALTLFGMDLNKLLHR